MSSTNVLIAVIGNRDLAYPVQTGDGESRLQTLASGTEHFANKLECTPTVRAIGTALLRVSESTRDGHGEWTDEVVLPILTPAIEWALADIEGGRLNVILVGTDQPEEEPHRSRDTLPAARFLAERVLHKRYDQLASCHTIRAVDLNPSAYDQAYSFLAQALSFLPGEIGFDLSRESVSRFYVSVRGGTPALSAAAVSVALDKYGKKTVLLEVDEPSGQTSPGRPVGDVYRADTWPLRKLTLMRTLSHLLERLQYTAALEHLIEETTAEERQSLGDVISLIRHGAARTNMNFTDAMQVLEDVDVGEAREWRESARAARDPRSLLRSAELRYIAGRLHEQGNYTGFVARLATFAETVSRRVAGMVTGGNFAGTRIRRGELPRQFESFLEENGHDPVHGQWWYVNRSLLKHTLAWGRNRAAPDGRQRRLLQDVQDCLQRMEAVIELRHNALHQSRGISRRDILHALQDLSFPEDCDTLLERAKGLQDITDANGRENSREFQPIYSDLNEAVLQLIDTGPHV